jgi:hypothetical protein
VLPARWRSAPASRIEKIQKQISDLGPDARRKHMTTPIPPIPKLKTQKSATSCARQFFYCGSGKQRAVKPSKPSTRIIAGGAMLPVAEHNFRQVPAAEADGCTVGCEAA